MESLVEYIFSSAFMPHGHCYQWRPDILWTHVIGDGLTAIAYFTIPILLIRFNKKRPDFKSRVVFLAFAAFILTCGVVHVFAIISVWNPLYMLEGILKMTMALVSLGTVIFIIKNFSAALALPSIAQLKMANQELEEAVSQSKKAVSDLEQSEKMFRNAMRYAPIGKALVALDGKWLEVNQAICDMLGYNEDEFLATNFQTLTHEDDLEVDLHNLDRIINGEINTYQMEKRYITKAGDVVWGLLGVSLVRKKNNEPDYFISQIVDINESKKMEVELLHLNNQLEEKILQRTADLEAKSKVLEYRTVQLESANEELGNFSHSVSHDLKAPLRALEGFSRILLEKYGTKFDEDASRWLKFIQENAIKMGISIDDILAFSKASRDALKYVEEVDMNELTEQVYAEQLLFAKSKKIELIKGDLHRVPCDPKMLEHVWSNLIGNAIKYSQKKEHPQIKIASKTNDNFVTYTISDNGDGFDEKYAASIFNVFKRLHDDSEFEGTGIGLAIVKRIVSKHNGTVTASGVKGKGATFSFSLPLAGV